MQRLHRRKNKEIVKQYVCSQGCGKTYGSYAAVYTHVRNKHPNSKPPEMKAEVIFKVPKDQKIPNRWTEKPKDNQIAIICTYDCKVCKKVECICQQSINNDELQRAVHLLSDQTFIKLINLIGQLQQGESPRLVRDTQLPHHYLSKQKIREMFYEFNQKYEHLNLPNLPLSHKWTDYLSFSSHYWNIKYLNELYHSKQSVAEISLTISNLPQFQNIKLIQQNKSKEWTSFIDFVKAI